MRRILTAATLALLLSACGSQPPAPEQNAAGVESRTPTDSSQVTRVTADGVDPYSIAELNNPKSILAKRSVFFDYDQYVIKDEFRPLVEAHARFLLKNAKVKVLIQGNADERGSREYNLALGQKRSEAVKKAMSLLGAKEEQMEAVSLGEEKPRCTDHTEECWAQNRRADLVYSEQK
jgi:peptidoglycan-associated lipoprotein